MMRTRASSISESENFIQNLEVLKAILGDDFNEDKIKHALRGADGDVEIALNHLLNDKEKSKEADDVSDTNSLTPLEKVLCELAEEVKCPMCLGYFRNPLVLACFHTFCATCLESITGDENSLQCPLCRNKSLLDEKVVSGLKQNHYLANIVEKLKSAQNNKMCGKYFLFYFLNFKLNAPKLFVQYFANNVKDFCALSAIRRFMLCDYCITISEFLLKMCFCLHQLPPQEMVLFPMILIA